MHFDVWLALPSAAAVSGFIDDVPCLALENCLSQHAEGKGNDKLSVISKGSVSQLKTSEFRLLTVYSCFRSCPCLSNPVLHEELLRLNKMGDNTFPAVLAA